MPQPVCPTCGEPVPETALFCAHCGARTGLGDSRVNPGSGADVPSRLARALGSKYQVRRLLGEGGFAQVYEVWDTDLQRRLALKVLKPDIAWSAGMLERFRQECRAIARLNHANILAIHFVGEGEGLVYYAMPFVEGESLSALLRRRGALDTDAALAILRPLLDALSHAHGQGLIHRDIKPDNILIEAGTGRPLLVDFGIAKRLDGGGHRTQTGFVVGTPQYMSPEQALGQGDLDARSDIYSVGAVLYQMVTGTPPFDGETSQEIVGKHLSEPPPIATSRNARIPMWLSDIIGRCLAKFPAERFQSAAMMLEALKAGQDSGSAEAVSAERVARQLQDGDATQLLPANRAAPAGPPADPTRPVRAPGPPAGASGPAAPAPSQRRSVAPLLLVGLLVVVFGWVLLRARPTLVVENRLVEPIRLVMGTRTVEIAPGARIRQRVTRKGPLVAQWYLVRPLGPGGKPLGMDLQGSITEPVPRGRMLYAVESRSAAQPAFAPLITNATAGPLSITVNAGLVDAQTCSCQVSAGAVRAHIGYYPLFQNSTVQAIGSGGASATFRNLGDEVDRHEGTVGLRFEEKDFR